MKKAYLWLLASIMLVSSLSADPAPVKNTKCGVAHEAPNLTKDMCQESTPDLAIIMVHDGTANPLTIRQKLVALYERIKHAINDLRASKPKQDPEKLKKTLKNEILKLIVTGKISPQEVHYLQQQEAILLKLTHQGPKVLTHSIQLLSNPEHQAQESAALSMQESNIQPMQKGVNQKKDPVSISQDIIYHLSSVITELTKIMLQNHQALMNKLEHHIIHLRAEIELALQKSLLQHFTEQELNEIHAFIDSTAFKKLVKHVPMLKDIFFKDLKPEEILSKIKTLI